jgi:hypothetical protein
VVAIAAPFLGGQIGGPTSNAAISPSVTSRRTQASRPHDLRWDWHDHRRLRASDADQIHHPFPDPPHALNARAKAIAGGDTSPAYFQHRWYIFAEAAKLILPTMIGLATI